MLHRSLSLAASLPLLLHAFAQSPGVIEGTTFSSSAKTPMPDVVVDGIYGADGSPVLFVEDGLFHKVVRLDNALRPAGEVSLHDVTFDGVKWQGIAPIVHGDAMDVLFVSGAKKSADYGIAHVSTSGAPALEGFRRVASIEEPYLFDKSVVASRKTLPDLILFDSGIAYDERERVVTSPNGQHHLLNFYTRDTKGNKQFHFTCLDASYEKEWSGKQELPFPDIQSDVHQVEIDDAGNIFVLSYVFKCKSEEQASDKNCHETHLSIISAQGTKVRDLLVDKDFVSSARIRPLADGKVMIAVRYGALTGLPGQVVVIDPADVKLKVAPLVDQRTPNVHHVKLLPFGIPAPDGAKKPAGPKTGAKVPDEVVDIVPAWDGGVVLLEAFREDAHQIPINEGAVAVRHLFGAIRATFIDAKDSVRWQHVADRGLFTTAGDLFGAFAWSVGPQGLVLVHGNTPGGEAAVLREVEPAADGEGKKKKKEKDAPKPVEHSELRITLLGKDGKVLDDKAVTGDLENMHPRLTATVTDAAGKHLLLECFDMERAHRFLQLDLDELRPH